MRKTFAILASLVTLAVTAVPAAAASKNSGDQKAGERQDSSSCHSYVQNPDGSWTAIPCQEIGPPAHPQHKSSGHGEDDPHR